MARVKKIDQENMPAQKEKKSKSTHYVVGIGRRKESIARVRLYPEVKGDISFGEHIVKKGEILVNGKPIKEYFPHITDQGLYTQPFSYTKTEGKYAFTIKVSGGGKKGQIEAVILGISRALEKNDPSLRILLKEKCLLTRDSRIRQRRKVGMGGKSRRKKQSPKR